MFNAQFTNSAMVQIQNGRVPPESRSAGAHLWGFGCRLICTAVGMLLLWQLDTDISTLAVWAEDAVVDRVLANCVCAGAHDIAAAA